MRRFAALAVLWSSAALAGVSDDLKRARENVEYGDYPRAAELALRAAENPAARDPERVEAYRLLGLAQFNLGKKDDARGAFMNLLSVEPDYALDPFFVPPVVVAFFDQVKTDNEVALAQIRERKRLIREQERLRDEDRRRFLAEEEKRKKLALDEMSKKAASTVVRRIEERQYWIVWMPFGLGQVQNGDTKAGGILAALQLGSGLVSAGSYTLIEALREGTGRFDQTSGNLNTAERLNVVKWITAGLFYGLWAYGVYDAHQSFQSQVVREEIIPLPAPPLDARSE